MKDEFLNLINDDGSELSGCGRKKRTSKRVKRTKLSGIKGGKHNYTKSDITKYAADKCGLSQAKAKCIIDATFEFIKQKTGLAPTSSDDVHVVTIAGFGSFREKNYKFHSYLHGKKSSGTRRKLTFKASK